jgi:aspartate racemase
MHKVVPEIEAHISIPILHIADATAQRLVQDGVSKVGLLGTQFTMEQDFYKGRLSDKFGIEVIVPDKTDREAIHHVIYDELCRGIINQASQEQYLKIIAHLHEQGAQAVILGCTEIALLVNQESTCIPLYDTTEIHAQQGVEFALRDED